MSSLRDAFASETRIKKGPPCTVEIVRLRLDDDDRATLDELIAADPREVKHSQIERATTAVGHRIPAGTISRHRAGLCGCDR